jgi:hypothetical protein
VKGPPGTGKSHTIANLICHLLAMGHRVLVTAHAPKALAVLRGLLPDDVRDLCVTAMGSSREDQRLLEESVRGILRRKNEWRGPEHAQRAIDEAERRLQALEGELAASERYLREFREAETHPHNLPGGYSGTAAQIARAFHERRKEFDWFPDGRCSDVPFPLDHSESAFLAEVHAELTTETIEELRKEVGEVQLPNPDQFRELIANLMDRERVADRAASAAPAEKFEILEQMPQELLHQLGEALQALDDVALKATRALGDLTETVLADLLAGSEDRWTRLALDSQALLSSATALLDQIGAASVDLPTDIHEDRLRSDVRRRLEHFKQSGRKGFSIFAPRVVKETQYVSDRCRVDGERADGAERLKCVLDRLELERNIHKFREIWISISFDFPGPKQAVGRAEDLTKELGHLLQFVRTVPGRFGGLPSAARVSLALACQRQEWMQIIDRKSTRLNSSHRLTSRMPSSA